MLVKLIPAALVGSLAAYAVYVALGKVAAVLQALTL